jgi:hypothetical protein
VFFSFVSLNIYWINKVQEYHTFVKDTSHLSDDTKLSLLQNTIPDIPELCQIRINAEMELAKGGKELIYQQYTDLLLSACNAYDKVTNPNRKFQRNQQVYVMDNTGEFDISNIQSDNNDEDYNVDTLLINVIDCKPPIQTQKHRINESQVIPKRNFIPKEDWLRIPEDVRRKLVN